MRVWWDVATSASGAFFIVKLSPFLYLLTAGLCYSLSQNPVFKAGSTFLKWKAKRQETRRKKTRVVNICGQKLNLAFPDHAHSSIRSTMTHFRSSSHSPTQIGGRGTYLSAVPLSGLALLSLWCKVHQQILETHCLLILPCSLKACIIKLWSTRVFCLKAFTPPSPTLIIFYTNVSVCKLTKPEVYCVLIYLLYTGMKWITPSPLNCHDTWNHFTQMHKTSSKIKSDSKSSEGVVALNVACFIEDSLIHFCSDPLSLVNINVSALHRWLTISYIIDKSH